MATVRVKHTPGPWKHEGSLIYSETAGVSIAIMANRATNTADTKPITIGGKWDEAMHDARLIAAAPELLEELQKAIRCLEYVSHIAPDLVGRGVRKAVVNSGNSVIKKAAGQP